jgi:hypothetical protein
LFKRFKKSAALGVLMVAGALAMGAQAFTANNTVPGTHAGVGAGGISGYVVTNPVYTFSSDGSQVTGVSFDLDAAATNVQVKLISSGTTWTDCGASTGLSNSVACTGMTIAAGSADQLMVQAQNNAG